MNRKICNVCGKELDIFDRQEGFGIHNKKLGYGTKHDGSVLNLNVCCKCMDFFISQCAVSPVSDDSQEVIY